MFKNTVKIDGMMCSMCEAHINDVIRKTVPGAKKVSASHSKGLATFVTEEAVEESLLRAGIEETGYRFLGLETEPYEKKGWFGRR